MYFVKVISVQYRIRISKLDSSNGKHDEETEIFKNTIDICKFLKGAQNSFLARLFMENLSKAQDDKKACPYPKYSRNILKDLELTDKFLPPSSIELKFKDSVDVFGIVEGVKKYQKLFAFEIVGRLKK
jgi:Protein of unknown function (DUF1091)